MGAKDQSNHLVAGSHRSFPQDSRLTRSPFEEREDEPSLPTCFALSVSAESARGQYAPGRYDLAQKWCRETVEWTLGMCYTPPPINKLPSCAGSLWRKVTGRWHLQPAQVNLVGRSCKQDWRCGDDPSVHLRGPSPA